MPKNSGWFRDRMPDPALLEELLAGNPTSRLLGVAKDRAIANGNLDPVPRANQDAKAVADMLELAVSAARVVSKSGAEATLTPAQEGALELFVLLVSRPALFVAGGSVTELPENWPELQRDRTLIPGTTAAVGRVEGANRDKLGTAFLAGERRILTNNHVLCALFGRALDFWEKDPNTYAASCQSVSAIWSDSSQPAPRFELLGEAGSQASRAARITRVLDHHSELDLAVLEIDAEPAGAQRLRLADTEPEGLIGRRLYAVGYPVDDQRTYWGTRVTPVPVFQRVFGADDETLGTKRLSPGLVTGWNGSAFLHDASTLPGSSGSCLVDFESRRVIGIHFRGSYRDQRNQAIPVWRLREDPMLIAQGIGFGAD